MRRRSGPVVGSQRDTEENTTKLPKDLNGLWLVVSVAGVTTGALLWVAGIEDTADLTWGLTTAIAIPPLLVSSFRGITNRTMGVDVIAALAIVGSLALDEYLAGAIIALMLASGRALESFANRRARQDLSSLLERAPRTVTRYEDGSLALRPVEDVRAGDLLMVKGGEVVPVDGVLVGTAVLDDSALTGESRPTVLDPGASVSSGAVNAGSAFDLRATATAEGSTYAGIIRLVREAAASKAPSTRLADRYAGIFVPVALTTAAVAWAVSGDPTRALSVLVVATPCPLILAVPVAIVAGVSRAARMGIIVKGGGALEALGRARILLFDKTGTLTMGVPRVADIQRLGSAGADELIRLAASLDQVSAHVFADAIVRAARERGIALSLPEDVVEEQGSGIRGRVEGRLVALGTAGYVSPDASLPADADEVRGRVTSRGASCAFLALDGSVAGAIVIEDPVRPDAADVIRRLRRAGIERVVMVTGDHPDVASSVAATLGLDEILSERSPVQKVEAAASERHDGLPTIMVGDGINDAPALASADVGVAMGARGASAASEAADVVIAVDRLDRLVDAITIAQRSRSIARQSAFLGMGLAIGCMFLAAFGLLNPVGGAIVQELIDVAAILNALRALGGRSDQRP
ncbi:MAG TPA: heavy metal translocating P-type ATPase [Actinomycetota bacterium]